MENNQILLTQQNFNKLKDEVKKAKSENKILIYSSDDDELNRKVLEKLPVSILLINLKNRKDFQKQRNSGFNQVMAKEAKKNNIVLGINFDEIIEERNLKDKSELIARIKQNIFLCNKNKVKMKFIIQKSVNSRNVYDLKSLGLILCMPTWMVSEL
jgi:RNase P/RNase MRP subunit p30